MRHSQNVSFNSLPPVFGPQDQVQPVCGSAWGLIADRLAVAQPPLRLKAVPPRRESAEPSNFSMSGFG